ncbi:MAG: hypothetical protein C4292_06800, partial [Nitrososphaera sp.]
SVLQAMRKGKSAISVQSRDYASRREIYEHAHYIVKSSHQLLLEYTFQKHPSYYRVVKWALNSYTRDPNSTLWKSLAGFSLYLTQRVSKKVNMHGHNAGVFENKKWGKLITMGLLP